MTKLCRKCKVIKSVDEFYFSERDGYYYCCKECSREIHRNLYQSRKDYTKEYAEKNKEKLQEYRRNRYLKQKAAGLFDTEEYKEQKSKIHKKTYEKNKHKYLPKRNEYHKKRRKNDPMFRLALNLRKRTNVAIKRKSWNKANSAHKFLGCTLLELREHISNQFREGMTWENYGKWHVDHVIPLVLAKTVDEMYELCHYSNLQPLWASENSKKGSKIIKKEKE